MSALAATGGMAMGEPKREKAAVITAAVNENSQNPQHQPLLVQIPEIGKLHVTSTGRIIADTFQEIDNGGLPTTRLDCPGTSSLTTASFTGGTYTAQGGFGEGEIAAATYTLPAAYFPLKILTLEFILAQQNATVQTTTEWSFLVYDGLPTDAQPAGFPIEYSSDDLILPHARMQPGTQGLNVQVSVDPNDPEQIYIYNPNNLANKSFTIAFRIDRHNNQTANPCLSAPPATSNAFPVTDNTVIGCGTGYASLNFPNQNWLFALNCGANGCPPNGGWTRIGNLQADFNFGGGLCITGCRPRGDWVMRATWDPTNCPPPEGACCFGTAGCAIMTQAACASTGSGTWQGPGTTCGTFSGGVWSGCAAPVNQPPVANAGPDQTVTDSDNSGGEVVVVDGSASTDSDGFISHYRWSEGATVLQDGPAFMSTTLSVGTHTLTLQVTDDDNATHTDTVVITVNGGPALCPADLDNDGDASNGLNPDGGVDINDLLVFLGMFEAGAPGADLDNDGDPAAGNPDGGVDINDLLFFLAHFESGC
jgi:hypothetical protein